MILECLVLLSLQETNMAPVSQTQSRGASFIPQTQSVLYHTAERLNVRDLAKKLQRCFTQQQLHVLLWNLTHAFYTADESFRALTHSR